MLPGFFTTAVMKSERARGCWALVNPDPVLPISNFRHPLEQASNENNSLVGSPINHYYRTLQQYVANIFPPKSVNPLGLA